MAANRHHKEAVWCLLLGLLISAGALLQALQSWVLILFFCALCVRVLLLNDPTTPSLKPLTINLLAILTSITLVWTGIGDGLLNGMLNLLFVGIALKLITLQRQKDVYQLFACGIFAVSCQFIFDQSISAAAVGVLATSALVFSLYLHHAGQERRLQHLRSFVQIAVQALPLTILLFISLPKLPPLWQVATSKSATTGLTDVVTPGDIAQLARSAKLAFTVEFTQPLPEPQQRYWRAITLEGFDGRHWTPAPSRAQQIVQIPQLQALQQSHHTASATFSYRIIAEPSGQPYLFAIDLAQPEDSRHQLRVTSDFQVRARKAIDKPFSYRINSQIYPQLYPPHTEVERQLNLHLPPDANPLAQAWAQQQALKTPHSTDFINAVQTFIRQHPFSYSLTPPYMPKDAVDAFLFQHQTGFCVHYASAVVIILRAANIPARMVTGYLGGELISENVMLVRQYDAHAWVEYMNEQGAWIRIDPTAWIAPERITSSLSAMLRATGQADLFEGLYPLRQFAWFDTLHQWMSQVNYQWTRWVVGFSEERQRDLIKQLLGEVTAFRTLLFGAISLGGMLLLFLWFYRHQWQGPKQPGYVKAYLSAVKRVEVLTGLPRAKQSPREYLAGVQPLLTPPAYQAFTTLTQAFEQLHYQPYQPALYSAFKQAFRHFRRHSKRA